MVPLVDGDLVLYALISILVAILVAPLVSRRVEENLEIFFLVMGLVASIISGSFGAKLLLEALKTPVVIHDIPLGIFQAVLISGLLFERYRERLRVFFTRLGYRSLPAVYASMVLLLGFGSSVISAIVASAIIAEVARTIGLPQRSRTILLVLPAYSIGVGAALTPLGEPLSTIAIAKLSGEPYHADFLFLTRLLWDYVLAIVLITSIASWYIYRRSLDPLVREKIAEEEKNGKNYREAIIRAIKVYIFVFALVLLGHSFEPVVDRYIAHLSPEALYLFGSTSAFLDNATLTAAIITPEMDIEQIKSFLVSLLISGGFLIPGNVPNIVIAYINKIGFREWAVKSIPLGLPLFVGAFISIFYLGL